MSGPDLALILLSNSLIMGHSSLLSDRGRAMIHINHDLSAVIRLIARGESGVAAGYADSPRAPGDVACSEESATQTGQNALRCQTSCVQHCW